MKPIIGIVEWPYLDKDGDKIYEVVNPIVEWVIRCGGRPVGLFPTNIDGFVDKRIPDLNELTEIELRELKEMVTMCDGIIKPGATKMYPHEHKIYQYAYDENIPYLGICAGMQIMRGHNAEYSPNIKNDSNIIHQSKEEYVHKVQIVPNTLLYSILKKDEIMVNSRHNYHIPNAGIKNIAAYAEDGVIEALEDPNKLFHLGVQWHPEDLPIEDENSQIIFGEFIEASKNKSKRIMKKYKSKHKGMRMRYI